jgi:hypothetical protein
MLIDALVVTSTVAGLVLGRQVLRSLAGVRDDSDEPSAVWRRPWVWLGVVVAALYVNQVLCTVYILRVHGGDPSFIADHLPPGWFNLADDNRLLRAIAEFWPTPEALAVTVLRVPALLELPFALLAYVTVLWWADRALCRRVLESPLIWVASVAYSATFCVIELALLNPYTRGDLVLRIASASVTPLLVRRLAVGDGTRMADHDAPVSLTDVAALVIALGAFGVLVLLVYDTALLYNLQHLRLWTFGGAAALAALAAARCAASRWTLPATGATTASLMAAARWFLVLFFVPALSIRYTLGFGSAVVGLTAALAVGAAALAGGMRETLTHAVGTVRWTPTARALSVRVLLCVAASAVAGAVGLRWDGRYPEYAMLVAAGMAAIAALGTAALCDVLTPVYARDDRSAPVTASSTGGRNSRGAGERR